MADAIFDLSGKRIFVAGHNGLVGSALVRALRARGDVEILTASRQNLDLRDQRAVQAWFDKNRPDVVILAAARVGGIGANMTYPADFIYDNMMIEANVIHAAYQMNVQKLVFLGSSCIYPKEAPQPIVEESLMTGALEPTNAPYAMAKIAGITLCQAYRAQYGCDFISVMPCNLYGVGDRFDVKDSHVIPALMMRAHEAKVQGASSLSIWGSGQPRREFLYVDDAARGILMALEYYSDASPVNIGAGMDMSIADLARGICDVVGYRGELIFDRSQPDGVLSKLMDVSRMNALGLRPVIDLEDGLRMAYDWYVKTLPAERIYGS